VELKNSKITQYTSVDVSSVISSCTNDVLLLDGLTHNNSYPLLANLSEWFRSEQNRKAIIVSSLQLSLKMQDSKFLGLESFLMPSWSLLEYKTAIQDNKFYGSIMDLLDVYLVKDEDKNIDKDQQEFEKPISATESLDLKYFYAGGSARWMFSFPTMDIVKDIDNHIQRLGDPQKLISGLSGLRSEQSVNHLMMGFGNGSDHNCFLISEYASRIVSEKCQNEFVILASRSSLARTNPTFDGWIFECDFFTQLRSAEEKKCPLEVYDVDQKNFVKLEVGQRVKFLQVKDIKRDSLVPDTWLLPQLWNQGLYDAVQLLHGGVVRIIQVTRAKSHSLKLRYAVVLLRALKQNKYKIKSVQIAFIKPSEEELDIRTSALGKWSEFESKVKTHALLFGLRRNS
jgi:hypothetical protein